MHGIPRWLIDKESACQCRRLGFRPWVGKVPWRRKWQPTPVFLPGKFHRQRSLAGYSLWGRKIGYDWACSHIKMQAFQEGVKSAVLTVNTLSVSVRITLANIYWVLSTYLFIYSFVHLSIYLKSGLLRYNLHTVKFMLFSTVSSTPFGKNTAVMQLTLQPRY